MSENLIAFFLFILKHLFRPKLTSKSLVVGGRIALMLEKRPCGIVNDLPCVKELVDPVILAMDVASADVALDNSNKTFRRATITSEMEEDIFRLATMPAEKCLEVGIKQLAWFVERCVFRWSVTAMHLACVWLERIKFAT